ncbi:MAG: cyanoexosortase A [Geminocystis sp.]|nr:cyanoexosortase A [Geminocystis sp.]HIK38141.1 cyanoexosortase A [Geminocystis sp. M7585_C2015_104]MCS7147390.1 cyanoexosortase A [Geminocystis sp.]MCX8079374.1 cyanoexosortase A [Geminocystis sp.]MDW8117080.1 cyanoexosortase A [Geminocystis sp.]
MVIKEINTNRIASKRGFWLWVALSALVAINIAIFWQMKNFAHAGMSVLYWSAVYSLLWDRRREIVLKTDFFSCIFGVVLIVTTLVISSHIPTTKESHIHSVSPFFFSLGLALIASGFSGLKQFWRELLIIFFLGIPRVIFNLFTDISPLTAKAASFILYYMGFEVSRDGVYISLPQGTVKVYEGCSGIESVTYVLGLSVICLVMFPIKKRYTYFVPVVAILIGFFVNALRVALMAILVAYGNREAFVYWHEGDGSLIFGMIAVGLFGGFYWLLLSGKDRKNSSFTPDDSFF